MRIRRDAAFISSILFTIALLCLLPISLRAAMTGRDKRALEALDAGYQAAAQSMGDLGVASLVIISIGLIVTWTGYINKIRWTWLVMFIIVWGWAFPLLLLPLRYPGPAGLAEWLSDALQQPGPHRATAESILIVLLMVIALILPAKSFLRGTEQVQLTRID